MRECEDALGQAIKGRDQFRSKLQVDIYSKILFNYVGAHGLNFSLLVMHKQPFSNLEQWFQINMRPFQQQQQQP